MPLLRTTPLVHLLLPLDTSWPLSPILYWSAHFSAIPTLYTPNSFCVHIPLTSTISSHLRPHVLKTIHLLIFLSGCMLIGKLPNSLMHVVIMPLLKCKSKDPADVNNYRPIAIATALCKVLEQVLLSRLARYLWTVESQFGFKQEHWTEMTIFALKQSVDFYCNQDTPVYMCFLDAKNVFDRI